MFGQFEDVKPTHKSAMVYANNQQNNFVIISFEKYALKYTKSDTYSKWLMVIPEQSIGDVDGWCILGIVVAGHLIVRILEVQRGELDSASQDGV